MRRQALSCCWHAAALTLILCGGISVAQNSPQPTTTVGDSTVEQFREYLSLSGVGEDWRTSWIAALDPNWRRVAAPYWPSSMEVEMRDEMKKIDLAPSVWSAYHAYYSRQEMAAVNQLLRDKGINGYLASPVGKQFCREWALHEDQGHQEISRLTFEVLDKVYERDKRQIKAARAEYLKTHPNFRN